MALRVRNDTPVPKEMSSGRDYCATRGTDQRSTG